MKVYVINLDRRPDRLAFFTEQAAALDFNFIRITAVDGQEPEIAERASRLPMGFTGTRLGAMQLACFESHRKAWRCLLDSGEKFALVMEDDMVLADNFSRLLYDGWIPRDADLVRLETFMTAARFDHTATSMVGNRTIWRMRSTMLGAGAYILSRRAAQALHTATENLVDALDEVLFSQFSPLFAQMVIYQLIPAPAIQGKRRLGLEQQGWAQSSLAEERVMGLGQTAVGLRKYKLWWRLNYWVKPVRAWLKGFRKVPFG